MLSRLKLSATYFLIILLALSVTQIFIDARMDASLNMNARDEKKGYSIFVDIEDKVLYLLDDGHFVKEYTIGSGKSGYPSPLGCWTIVDKGDWGEGFGGSWLGLDVPWGRYGIHGTIFSGSIGSACSQGCIRMFSGDVAELYSLVPIGTEVTIVNGPFGPFGRGFDEIIAGDRGADVLAIQQRLRQLKYYDGPLDGIYEDGMKKALHKFQRDNGLIAQNRITRDAWLKMGFREFE